MYRLKLYYTNDTQETIDFNTKREALDFIIEVPHDLYNYTIEEINEKRV